MSNIDFQNGFAIGVASQGKAKGYDNPLEYAKTLASVFDGATFPDNYEMTLEIPLVTSLRYAFRNTKGLNKLILKGQNSNIIDIGYAFNAFVTEIDLNQFATKFSDGIYAFGSTTLVKILGELDFSSATRVDNMFRNCTALEEIRIKANTIGLSTNFGYSSKLSAQSIQSIIDGLATVETAQTLTLSSAIVLTDEQKSTIQAKGWTLVQ